MDDDTQSPQIASQADQEPNQSMDPGCAPAPPDLSQGEQPDPSSPSPGGSPDGGASYGPDWTPTDHGYAYTPEGGESDGPEAVGELGVHLVGEAVSHGITAAGAAAGVGIALLEAESFPPDDPRTHDPYGYCDEHGTYIAAKPDGSEFPPYQPDQYGDPPAGHWSNDDGATDDSLSASATGAEEES